MQHAIGPQQSKFYHHPILDAHAFYFLGNKLPKYAPY